MKKVLVITVLLINVVMLYSQDKKDKDDMFSNKINKRGDMLIIDLFDDIWMNVPDSVDNRIINQGVSVSVTYNFPLGHSPFSLAAGLGIKAHNFYSNSILKTDSVMSYFTAIPGNKDYKINKVSVTYIQLPVEVRFKSKSKFRAALGFNLGFKIDGHTKYKGTDYIFGTTDQIKIKQKNTPNLANWNIAVTARFGYRWVNLFASYSITKMFSENKGPDIYPISVGLSIIPF